MNLDNIRIIILRQRLKQFLITPLYANAIYLAANMLVRSLLSFVFWIVIARFYTPVEVGYSSAIISVVHCYRIERCVSAAVSSPSAGCACYVPSSNLSAALPGALSTTS